MFGDEGDREVTCIACGQALQRADAREYDKFGDRWTREEKSFEYLCKPCDGDHSHLPRDGLETMLVESGAGNVDRETFLHRFCGALQGAPAEDR